MADLSAARGRSAVPDGPAAPRSIVELIQAGTLDAELAATLWVLIAGGVPIVVAGADEGIGKSTLLIALMGFLPSRVRRMELTGATESFDWLPQATEPDGTVRRAQDRQAHDRRATTNLPCAPKRPS
ncbi:MAG: hypothetical protein WKF78_13240 [Candidatus Limnocylindrales bacterium]